MVFYKDALLCARCIYLVPLELPHITQLSSVKDMIGTYHFHSFNNDDLMLIARSIWMFGWGSALCGFAFCFGFFGTESPLQAFTCEINPIRSMIYKRQNIVCAVCLGNFEAHHPTHVVQQCGHYYHTPCLEKWHAFSLSCPLCRC